MVLASALLLAAAPARSFHLPAFPSSPLRRGLRPVRSASADAVDVTPTAPSAEDSPAPAAPPAKPHVAVVGAGWGGWGAAKSLAEAGCKVTLLDAIPDPTGATPYLSSSGKPVEAGTRGFWKDYPNM